jgi:hypothetical protein
MGGYFFLLPTLAVILFSYLLIRAAAIALMLTGLEEKKARFQALSAFTGTGYTTREAEMVMNHDSRRRIMSLLMLLGHAQVVTVIITTTSSIIFNRGFHVPLNIVFLALGIYLIYRLGRNRGLTRKWDAFIKERLIKWPEFEEGKTENLLHLGEGYVLVRTSVIKGSPLIGLSLADSQIKKKGLLILGIERGSEWRPVPEATQKLVEGDRLVVYGPMDVLQSVF